MEEYNLRIKAVYDSKVKADSFDKAWKMVENTMPPGWAIDDVEVIRKEEHNA